MFKRPARRAGNGRVTTYRILLTAIIINVNVKHVNKFFRILSSIDRYEWYYDRRLSPIQTLIRTGAFRGGDFNQRDISIRDIYNIIFLFEKSINHCRQQAIQRACPNKYLKNKLLQMIILIGCICVILKELSRYIPILQVLISVWINLMIICFYVLLLLQVVYILFL